MSDDLNLGPRQVPDVLAGRYRIVSRLGVGGMGIVYKATDTQLNRSVAVKALEERRLHVLGAAARLRSEALAAASLDHPYICKVYELIETPADSFIVMEFVDGETLASMLKRGKLPVPQVLQLGREIAEGLANAHARGLVHRDVKPGNVMVTPHGHVKLLDFGIAGADVESTSRDETRTLSPQLTVHTGTPQYMAPEQAAGQPVTTRADLFSLGVLLYESLTGQLPFSGTTTFDYVRHVMQSAPRRLDRVAPDAPADLADLIDRLLEKQPADRPASADAVVLALRAIEDSMTAPTGGVRSARQARAGRRWKTVAAAALALVAVLATWRWIWPHESATDEPRQLRPFVTTSAAESGSRISANGEWMSFIATSAGLSRILVQRIDGGESRPLTLGPGEPVSQIWSPDGNQIATVMMIDGAPALQIYPAFFGGAPVQSVALDKALGSIRLLRWIGRDLYFRADAPNQQAKAVRRISLDSPDSAVAVSDRWKMNGVVRGADIRPDGGAAVVVLSKDGQEDLWTVNLDGSAARQLTSDAFFDREPIWIDSGRRVVFQSNRGGQVDLWQIDVSTKTLTALTSSEAEEVPESSSLDGRIISFQQLTKDANLWVFGAAGGAQQVTQDSLSDYAPVLSGDGRTLAFQRSQPTPSRGYTIFDAKVFVAPFDGRKAIDAKAVADGFAPDLSADGQWLATMQVSEVPRRMTLSVHDLRRGGHTVLSRTAALPSLTLAPVDWATRLTGWSRDGSDLYFVDHPDGHAIRRYRTSDAAPGPPLATEPDDINVRDLSIAPDTGHIGYVTNTTKASATSLSTVHDLDPVTGANRVLTRLPRPESGTGIIGRGWVDQRFLLLRLLRFNADGTSDLEFLTVGQDGTTRTVGRVTHVFHGTARLHAARRAVYMTRLEQGTSNVFMLSLDTGALAPVTQNALPGVTFSGFQPFGPGAIGVREESRQDIWLIQSGTKRPGNPAGR